MSNPTPTAFARFKRRFRPTAVSTSTCRVSQSPGYNTLGRHSSVTSGTRQVVSVSDGTERHGTRAACDRTLAHNTQMRRRSTPKSVDPAPAQRQRKKSKVEEHTYSEKKRAKDRRERRREIKKGAPGCASTKETMRSPYKVSSAKGQ